MANIALAFLTLVCIQLIHSGKVSFKWCVKSSSEKAKCDEFAKYVNDIAKSKSIEVAAVCVVGNSSDDCITKITNKKADLVTLDGGRVFDAGKQNNLIPLVSEQYGKYGVKYYGVAVVRRNNEGFNLKSLKGKKSCHTGARRTAGWRLPIGYMIRLGLIPTVKCGDKYNDFLSAAAFFNKSCLPDVKKYNDSGDIPGKLCALCAGTGEDQCSGDPTKNMYAGYHGSFKCMAVGGGDVAFVKHTTVDEVVEMGGHGKVGDYQYLCKDGSRKDIGQHENCHIGFNPAHAVVTRNENSDADQIVTILTSMSEKYGSSQTDWTKFQLFNSTKYSNSSGNLIFKDSATSLIAIEKDKRTYQGFLGDDYVKDSEALKSCDFLSSVVSVASVAIIPYRVFVLLTVLMAMISI